MGIPYYFMSLIKSHSGIIRTIKDPLKVDILCIDFNCLIHKYLKAQDPIESVIEGLKLIMENICNAQEIIIAFDGLVPYGKIVQQRYRRMHLKDSVDEFDRNQISPDTPYMKKLENELQNRFPNIKISPTQKSGEGEHKIFRELRKLKDLKSICIYGLDADLILLSLYHHNLASENMFLLRESIEMHSEGEFSILNCKLLSTILPLDIKQYLVLCILCFGNDFMPNLALFSLRDGGYERALHIYTKIGKPDLLTEDGRHEFLKEASKYEIEFLQTKLRKNSFERSIIHSNPILISKKYYLHNLDGVKNIDNVVIAYWKIFHWTLDYFMNNKPLNWSWSYPYSDAPLINDIIQIYEVQCEKSPLKFTITDQLKFILPSNSLKITKRKPIFKDEIYTQTRPIWIKRHDWEMKPAISLPWNPNSNLTSISPL
jgi:5'-3' exonuclease